MSSKGEAKVRSAKPSKNTKKTIDKRAKQTKKALEDEVAELIDVHDTFMKKKRNHKSLKGVTNPVDAISRSSPAANKKFFELWAKSMYQEVNGTPAPQGYGEEEEAGTKGL